MYYKFVFVLLLPLAIGELILLNKGNDSYCILSGEGKINISQFPGERIIHDKEYYKLTNITEKEKYNCTDSNTGESISLKENKKTINGNAFVFSCGKKGFFGSKCDLNCTEVLNLNNCSEVKVCNSTQCSCLPGYKGPKCGKGCGSNKYGAKCNETCSENCKTAGSCDIVSGSCEGNCKEGWKGPKCTVQVATTTTSTVTTSTTTSPTTTSTVMTISPTTASNVTTTSPTTASNVMKISPTTTSTVTTTSPTTTSPVITTLPTTSEITTTTHQTTTITQNPMKQTVARGNESSVTYIYAYTLNQQTMMPSPTQLPTDLPIEDINPPGQPGSSNQSIVIPNDKTNQMNEVGTTTNSIQRTVATSTIPKNETDSEINPWTQDTLINTSRSKETKIPTPPISSTPTVASTTATTPTIKPIDKTDNTEIAESSTATPDTTSTEMPATQEVTESSIEMQPPTTKDYSEDRSKKAEMFGETTTLIVFSVLITLLVLMIVGCLIFGAKRGFVMKHLHRLRMASYNERQELFPMYARDVENQDGDGLQYFLPNAAASAIAGAEILSLSPIPTHSMSVAVSELRSYVEQAVTSGSLSEQHALFPRGQTQPWEEGQKAEHRGKNRYLKLYAYDHTRVQLTPLKNDLNSHYINANFIDGYEKQRQYIATQGPNKMTISDFWRMICQEDVTTIVMLANLVEEDKPKCEQYWPDVHKEIQYGSINIRNKEEKVFLDYTVRNFLVTNKTGMGEITRKVRQLHYTVWPDHGVVKYPHSLADFIRCMMDGGKPPFVIHCSAGVGRTGTVILSHACYQMAKIENRVDCLALVGKIRSQRANLVDRVEQYELVHRILIELLVVGDTRIPKEAFQTQLTERMEYGNGFMNQFQLLNEMSKQEAEKMENISWPPEKSRFPAITPGEHGRVMMENEATFINAVTVDGLKMKDKFIVTQLPLPETINDFWNMVVQEQVGAIVLLNEPQPSIDTSTTPLWNEPAESTMQLEALNVTAKQCNLRGYGDLTEILLEYGEEEAAGESRTVQQRDISVLRVKGWEYGVLMHGAPEDWVNIWRDVQLHSKNNLPIVVACHDGATASGLFVAASYVFENIDETGMVDVVSAVRNVRHNRPQFIAKYEQFEFLYEIASEYLNTYEIYANSDVILRYSQV